MRTPALTLDVDGTPPLLIQGGMGVAVSNHRLARAVAITGHLGVVSGTAIDLVLARRLQDGDPGGEMRDALAQFPVPAIADQVVQRYFLAAGRRGRPYRGVPMHSHRDNHTSQNLLAVAAFVEVLLAKRDHHGRIGINLLTKVQVPTVPTLFGAMLAGVDFVLMGAGIPRDIPGILDRLAMMEPVETRLEVAGASVTDSVPHLRFDPSRFPVDQAPRRPAFLPIVSSHTLATVLARKASGSVEGFIVEAPSAGGHNAPPRGTPTYDDLGQPRYGDRDQVDYAVMRDLGLPFWLAGGMDSPERVRDALDVGASGVQVGTLFAFCRESGIAPPLRGAVLAAVRSGSEFVLTSSRASSTGYPFKVASIPGTLSEREVYAARSRVCDLGYLREAYVKSGGGIGYRCAAEPVADHVAKGGDAAATIDRMCLCNGLSATIGLGQVRGTGVEPAVITSGDGLGSVRTVLEDGDGYSAADVVAHLLSGVQLAVRR
ncbi:MAG TPA: nitronate monooxygenase [Candidatus Saccharimonadales bacterium]|nr:nitronate monooxygenase [Candidatus Saccharimonadales bacterium]